MRVKIGTRGSKLALWQAHTVAAQLKAAEIDHELVEIQTAGDANQQAPLASIGGQGLFTKALDQALLSGEVDLAVHSAKDMPSSLPDGLKILACLEREDPRDVLLAVHPEMKLDNFSQSWVVGTGSVRRAALMRHYYPHVEVKPIRGNVDTRLAKLQAGDYDAILLAMAGVKRMGYEAHIRQKLSAAHFTPAVGQGVVAIVSRVDFAHQDRVGMALDHTLSHQALLCERAFLRTLQGGCSVPAFGLATIIGDQISLQAGMATEDDIIRIEADAPLDQLTSLGNQVGQQVLAQIS